MSAARNFKPVMVEENSVEPISPSKLAKEGFTGIVLEGEFVGTSTFKNDHGGESCIYTILKADGEEGKIYGTSDLDRKMNVLNTGDIVQIVYDGKNPKTTKDGKKIQLHEFTVLRDE